MKLKKICPICNAIFFIYPSVEKSVNYCSCNCHNIFLKTKPFSAEHRKKISESKKGSKHWNWKGGKMSTKFGYIYIHKPKHPYCDGHGYIAEHRYVVEQKIKRYLSPKEKVHHINHKRDDNRIENLMLFESNSKHTLFHKSENPHGGWRVFTPSPTECVAD